MNYLGISISFVIGGLLIISILTLNGRVIQNSGETVLNMSAKEKTETIRTIMQRDFMRAGYNMKNESKDAIQIVDSTRIMFWADVDDDSSTFAKKIEWRFNKPGNPAKSTGNPNDYELTRTVSGNTKKMTFPIIDFHLEYFDKNHNSTSDPAKIRSISVSIKSESPESYGDNGYSTSFWEESFTPPNIKLQDMAW